jgi:hypothetical protein
VCFEYASNADYSLPTGDTIPIAPAANNTISIDRWYDRSDLKAV